MLSGQSKGTKIFKVHWTTHKTEFSEVLPKLTDNAKCKMQYGLASCMDKTC